ncbi:MAG: hypothetical protein A2W47_04215 [Gammaproteobacteria bacterium RIFCSPHIGHO2_12_38_15]|nr:MAG: hypothetical protein A2W47_04215 [Gammaproteobacteria bacterium RIFCSPHIGHO2_12_38_15]
MGKDRYRGFEDEKTDDEVSRMFEREGRAEQESKKSVGQPKNPKHLQQQAAKEEKYFPPAVAKHDAKKEVLLSQFDHHLVNTMYSGYNKLLDAIHEKKIGGIIVYARRSS